MGMIVEPDSDPDRRAWETGVEFEDVTRPWQDDDPPLSQGFDGDHGGRLVDGDDRELPVHSEAVDRRCLEKHRSRG